MFVKIFAQFNFFYYISGREFENNITNKTKSIRIMSTPNFSKYNTKNYCVHLDENHADDFDFLMEDLGYCAEDKGFFPTSDYNRYMEMSIFAERSNYENRYNTELTEIEIESH